MTAYPYQPLSDTEFDSLLPFTTKEALLPDSPPVPDEPLYRARGAAPTSGPAVPFTLSRYLPTPYLSSTQRPDDE